MMKKILCIIIAILTAMGLSGCSSFLDNTSLDNNEATSSRYEFVGEIDTTLDYNSYLGYTLEIKGKLKNTTSRKFSYVSVTFAIYDENGIQIGTAMDNMNYLQAGNIWSFKAIGWTDDEPASYKLVEVSAW